MGGRVAQSFNQRDKPTNDPLCQTTCYADLPTTTPSTPINLRAGPPAAPQPVSTPPCCNGNLCATSVLPRTCMHCVPPLPRTCMHRPLPHTCMHRPAPQPASITNRTGKANAVLSAICFETDFPAPPAQAQPQLPHPLLLAPPSTNNLPFIQPQHLTTTTTSTQHLTQQQPTIRQQTKLPLEHLGKS